MLNLKTLNKRKNDYYQAVIPPILEPSGYPEGLNAAGSAF